MGLVAAHPFSGNRLGHRTQIHLSRDRIQVDYQVEVPLKQVLRELESAGETPEVYAASRLEELADGWKLKCQGELLSLSRLPGPPEATSSSSRFFSFHIRLESPIADQEEPQRLKLVNENFPDSVSFHHVEVQVDPGIEVLASSLFDLREGQVRNLREARWRMEEESRVTELLVQRDPPGILDRLLGPLVGEQRGPRYAHLAVTRPLWSRLKSGEIGVGMAAFGLVLSLGFGRLTGPGRSGRQVAVQVLSLVLLGVALVLLQVRFLSPAVSSWVPLIGGVVVCVGGGWLLRGGTRPEGVALLLVLGAAMGLQRPALGLALVAAYGVGLAWGIQRGDRTRTRLAAGFAVVAGAVLTLRGLGVLELL